MSSSAVFELVAFSPMGFKEVKYPSPYCSVCRGFLTDVCSKCSVSGETVCHVNQFGDSFYHNHCHTVMTSKNEPEKSTSNGKLPARPSSESESEESDDSEELVRSVSRNATRRSATFRPIARTIVRGNPASLRIIDPSESSDETQSGRLTDARQ